MEVVAEISSLRRLLGEQRASHTIAFVPTMGALHDGHRACVDVARAVEGAFVVVSIFVNPTQFGPGEDLDRYPRDLERDLELCRAWGTDAVFAPEVAEMYPGEETVRVEAGPLAAHLCGGSRPGHFDGVVTVVARLFDIVAPDIAVFGQKDAQQALVIRDTTRRLDLPVELRLARTERENDGLAISSRNVYLDGSARARAAGLYDALRFAGERIADGERDPRVVESAVRSRLDKRSGGDVEYAELRRAADLSALERIEGRVILALAVSIDGTRLIDNMVFDVEERVTALDVALF